MYLVLLDGFLMHDVTKEDLQIFDAEIKLEVNTPNFFEFKIYPTNPLYNSINRLKSIVEVFDDGELLFRGRPLNDETEIDKSKTVTCEGERAYLNDTVLAPYSFSGSITQYLQFIIDNHNQSVEPIKQFQLGNVTVTDSNNYIVRSSENHVNTWEEIKSKLVSNLGGYILVRRENDINYLDYLIDSTIQSQQEIALTQNMLDFNQEVKSEDIITCLIPLGAKNEETDERVTINSVNDGKAYIEHAQGVAKYGKIWGVQTWDDVTLPSNLKTKAEQELNFLVNLGISITIQAVDLHYVDADVPKFGFFEYVKIVSEPHKIDSYFLIKKQTISLDNAERNTISVGASLSSFVDKQLNQANIVRKINADYVTNNVISVLRDDIVTLSSDIQQAEDRILIQVTEQVNTIADGKSAYQIAVANGFSGTEQEWLNSLKGADGNSFTPKGTKESVDELPMTGNTVGDGYIIQGYMWTWTEEGRWVNIGRFQGQNGQDGIGYQVILTADDGLVYNESNDALEAKIRADVYLNNKNVTDTIDSQYFLWTRKSAYPEIDEQFNRTGTRGRVLTLTQEYLKTSATYEITLTIPSISGYLLDADDNYILDFEGNRIVVTAYSLEFKQQITIVRDLVEQMKTTQSTIKLLSDEIDLKVSERDLTGTNIINRINLSVDDGILISGEKIKIEGTTTINGKFQITQDGRLVAVDGSFSGVLEANQGNIGGFNIASTGLTKSLQKTFGPFTSQDYNIVSDIVQNKRTPTQEQLDKYDVNGDGRLTSADYVAIAQMINGIRSNPLTVTFTALLNTASHLEMMKFYNSLNNMSTTLGTSGVTAQTVECQYFILDGQEFKLDATTGYLKKV